MKPTNISRPHHKVKQKKNEKLEGSEQKKVMFDVLDQLPNWLDTEKGWHIIVVWNFHT